MFSNKFVYYYLPICFAIIMFLLAIVVGGVCLYCFGNLDEAMPYIKKVCTWGGVSLILPVLYKIFVPKAAEEKEQKKEAEKDKSFRLPDVISRLMNGRIY